MKKNDLSCLKPGTLIEITFNENSLSNGKYLILEETKIHKTVYFESFSIEKNIKMNLYYSWFETYNLTKHWKIIS